MSVSALHLPAAVVAVPSNVKKSGRIAGMSSRKAFFRGRRYLANQAWGTFYSMAVTMIPDDLYDWEDDALTAALENEQSTDSYQI